MSTVPVCRLILKAMLLGGLVLGMMRCDLSTAPPEPQSLVVEAFLDTGKPLPALTLRQTAPLNLPDSQMQKGVPDGNVTLAIDGESVSYVDSNQDGRYDPGREMIVPPRVPWQLTARGNGQTARAEGRTPTPISVTEVCVEVPESPSQAVQVDSLRRDSLDIPADQGYLYPINVTVRWEDSLDVPEAGTEYWVRAQLSPDADRFPSQVVDFFLEPAEIQLETAFAQVEGRRRWKGVYAVPVDSATAPLPRHTLRTTITRGDTAFASFAQTRTDPERREPISNVEGGLGVALAVSVDSLVRVVEPGVDRCQAVPRIGED